MRPNLRIAAEFNFEVATKFGVPGLKHAVVLDDTANLIHHISIEYAEEDDQLFQRLTYDIVSMQTGKEVGKWTNDIAQQLLTKIALALAGSTLSDNRPFEKGMFCLDPGQAWDNVLPSAKKTPAKKKSTPKKKEGDE